jgi:hypothetical protein
MRHLLHIVTTKNDTLAQAIQDEQTNASEMQVEAVDLTLANPNYADLVRKIFEADSIAVW